MRLSSPAFQQGGKIPEQYTCDGEDVSPPLEFGELPEGTKSLALVVDDPDAPGRVFVHWVLFDMAPRPGIEEGEHPGRQGRNDFGRTGYGGCCPPSGVHRYYFRLYALDGTLGLQEGATKQQVEQAMQGHVLARAELMGRYSR